MAKPARGLPADFHLDLPDEKPVIIGDFLDEDPPAPIVRKPQRAQNPAPLERTTAPLQFRPEIVRDHEEVGERSAPRPVARTAQPSVIRYQLNLTPKAKTMLEELVEHIRTYSPQNDARTSEVFQGITQLLHNAMDELELAELPRRGAWGSVTAKNFPGALSQALKGRSCGRPRRGDTAYNREVHRRVGAHEKRPSTRIRGRGPENYS